MEKIKINSMITEREILDEAERLSDSRLNGHDIEAFQQGVKWALNKINVPNNNLPQLTKQKLWEMAKVIVDKQQVAQSTKFNEISWSMLEEMWFDWLEEELLGEAAG